MTKITVLIVCVALFCVLNPPIAKADDMEDDFRTRLFDFKIEIIKKSADLKRAYIRSDAQNEREILDLQYRGRVSSDLRDQGYRNEDNKRLAEKDYEQLGKEIKVLKTEINKYYKGKTPRALKAKMTEVDKLYLEEHVNAMK